MTGRTGSALPGLIIEKIHPQYLTAMLTKLPQGVIIVSGTNGKTTTTKVITALLQSQGLRVLTNKTGSNFVRGIISVVADKATVRGNLPYDIAVFEQDEAHAVHLARVVKPRGVVVLNIMRDQMDRFGEIDTTQRMLQALVSAATKFVVLNSNDERVSALEPTQNTKMFWFGHTKHLQPQFLSDDAFYDTRNTGFHQAAPPQVLLTAYTNSSVSLQCNGDNHTYLYALQGSHNALNLAAAMAALVAVIPQYDNDQVQQVLKSLRPAFGRGEVISLSGGGSITLQLIKNPGGFTQSLRMLDLKPYQLVGICINDDYPDGRDVSWLWDVDFSCLRVGTEVWCGGTRAADMANRLHYDECRAAVIESALTTFAAKFTTQADRPQTQTIIFCTYTAMRKLRTYYLKTSSGLDDKEEKA
jgi:UDP-N-acetylmuramyl tripeptide synthase